MQTKAREKTFSRQPEPNTILRNNDLNRFKISSVSFMLLVEVISFFCIEKNYDNLFIPNSKISRGKRC